DEVGVLLQQRRDLVVRPGHGTSLGRCRPPRRPSAGRLTCGDTGGPAFLAAAREPVRALRAGWTRGPARARHVPPRTTPGSRRHNGRPWGYPRPAMKATVM